MTVRTLLESASSHTEVQIWRSSDHWIPIIGESCHILTEGSAVLDLEVAEFEVTPVSSDYATLVVFVMD